MPASYWVVRVFALKPWFSCVCAMLVATPPQLPVSGSRSPHRARLSWVPGTESQERLVASGMRDIQSTFASDASVMLL